MLPSIFAASIRTVTRVFSSTEAPLSAGISCAAAWVSATAPKASAMRIVERNLIGFPFPYLFSFLRDAPKRPPRLGFVGQDNAVVGCKAHVHGLSRAHAGARLDGTELDAREIDDVFLGQALERCRAHGRGEGLLVWSRCRRGGDADMLLAPAQQCLAAHAEGPVVAHLAPDGRPADQFHLRPLMASAARRQGERRRVGDADHLPRVPLEAEELRAERR